MVRGHRHSSGQSAKPFRAAPRRGSVATVHAARTASVLLGVAVVALGAAPASAQVADDLPRAAAGAKKKKPKKPVTCKAGQVRVKLGKRVTCRKLTKAVAQRDAQAAFLLAIVRRDLKLRTRRGRRITPIWSVGGGRLKSVRKRLVRALPKALALSAGRAARARAALTPGAASCADLANANVPDQSYTIDGFTMTTAATGAVTLVVSVPGGYRLEVIIDSTATCSNLDLPACPMPDGTLNGTDSRRSRIGMRITKDGALVNAFSVSARSTQKLKGRVADDAKLDSVMLEDLSRETVRAEVPGGSAAFSLSVLRTAELDMRSGATRNARVQAGVGGIDAVAVGKTVDEYARTFPDLISEERAAYKQREEVWQIPGKCASLTFDPASGSTAPLADGASGTVTGTIAANAGGAAAKAKWTVTATANGGIGPPTAQGGTAQFAYVVTKTGKNVRLSGSFKATSTAGVAEGTWTQKTVEPGADAYYIVDAVQYDADHGSSSTKTDNGICDVDGSVTESLALGTSRPFQPDVNKLTYGEGAYAGGIALDAAAPPARRTGVVHGCDISMGSPPPACDANVNLDVPAPIGVLVDIPANSPDAKLTWILPSVFVGDNGPGFPCYAPTLAAVPDVEKRTVSADDILKPGAHTVMVTRNVNFSAQFGHVQGVTGASITFHRVNADGSPYTG